MSEQAELLAPAGNWDCARAAVENGADAIYFGLENGFNARARATNFAPDDLPRLMDFLHERCVRGYVTVNTLAFPGELPELETVIRQIASAGADAVLVQDLGVVRLVREICPELAIHASTQMTLTSAPSIAAVEQLGVERVVLARELSIDEIGTIHQEANLSLEAFAHGALCVAYSGQCLTSESLGGRSANRGQCAQACRLPYELTCDGEDVDLGEVQYLLSPQDLAAYALIPEMLAAGVMCFKIEGRLKTAEYVANITRHYRQALDAALIGQREHFSEQQVRDMELSFSRGFSPGWLEGCDHKMLVPGLSSAKRGVFLGTVTDIRRDRVSVRLAAPIAPGDGIVFAGDRSRGEEQGGRVYQVYLRGRSQDKPVKQGVVELAFERRAIDLTRLEADQEIWKTDDPRLTAQLRKTYSGPDAHRRVPLDLEVEAEAGKPLRVTASAPNQARCEVRSDEPLQVARKHPLEIGGLRQQLGRLGATVYELRDVQARIEGAPMVPHSVLGAVRRKMIEQLAESLRQLPPNSLSAPDALGRLRSEMDRQATPVAEPALRVLCRSLAQLRAVANLPADRRVATVYADLQDIREYGEAVEIAQAAGIPIYLAPPRIQKPDEFGIFRAIARHGADGILARNLAGLLHFAAEKTPVVADYSLNVANDLTADYLRSQGAGRVTVSYDLNRDQLTDLLSATPAPWLEVVIHQHMPMFHMEHCVFCAVLSPGTNKTNCGRPCDVHDVKLRDRVGMLHPLKADVGCRNTLYNAVPQSSAEVVPDLLRRGLRDFRIELLDNSPDEAEQIVELYQQLLRGEVRGQQVWQQLRALNRVGVTRGTLESRRDPLAIL